MPQPGIKRLRKIQMGAEATSGTAVAATTIWRGMGNTLSDDRVIEEIEEMSGIIEGPDRTAVTKLFGGLELAETPLTFEQVQHLLKMGLGGATTGTADGSGSGKIYTTNIPTTSVPTAAPYTFEAGDDYEAERMAYCVPTKINIKGETGQTAKISATLIGHTVSTNAFTGSLGLPTIEDVLTSKGKVYLDTISGTLGTTQVANSILAFDITYELNWVPKWTMDGNLYFTFPVYTGHKISGRLTFEHSAAVSGTGGAKQYFRDQTPRLLRVDLIGNTLTTAGTAYSEKHVILDLPLKYNKANVLSDLDGNDTVVMEFRSRYNDTAAAPKAGRFIVVNELTTAG